MWPTDTPRYLISYTPLYYFCTQKCPQPQYYWTKWIDHTASTKICLQTPNLSDMTHRAVTCPALTTADHTDHSFRTNDCNSYEFGLCFLLLHAGILVYPKLHTYISSTIMVCIFHTSMCQRSEHVVQRSRSRKECWLHWHRSNSRPSSPLLWLPRAN